MLCTDAPFGVGVFASSWQKISESVLPGWDEQQLKLRTSTLLGTKSLERYAGWKGDAKVRGLDHALTNTSSLRGH